MIVTIVVSAVVAIGVTFILGLCKAAGREPPHDDNRG